MDAGIKSSINKLALAGGCVIAIQGIGLNFLVSLIISITTITTMTPILKFVFFIFCTNFELVQNIIWVSHGNCKKASSKFG
ncbi:hypothetical protein ADS77_21155 [Pseudoalteromonas porphyrae]|uniref:Uncharacterized protein n=1 Tax=Pseudoalteromonas porphyrae TaxID=187330 RepID=A0A0N1ECB6_9GAMM|nr:hypothetical protein ADS77_21155 [Pseudoalteromonas porphyrae]